MFLHYIYLLCVFHPFGLFIIFSSLDISFQKSSPSSIERASTTLGFFPNFSIIAVLELPNSLSEQLLHHHCQNLKIFIHPLTQSRLSCFPPYSSLFILNFRYNFFDFFFNFVNLHFR